MVTLHCIRDKFCNSNTNCLLNATPGGKEAILAIYLSFFFKLELCVQLCCLYGTVRNFYLTAFLTKTTSSLCRY